MRRFVHFDITVYDYTCELAQPIKAMKRNEKNGLLFEGWRDS